MERAYVLENMNEICVPYFVLLSIYLHRHTLNLFSCVKRNPFGIFLPKQHAPTNSTQKLKLMGRGGQFSYTSILYLFEFANFMIFFAVQIYGH